MVINFSNLTPASIINTISNFARTLIPRTAPTTVESSADEFVSTTSGNVAEHLATLRNSSATNEEKIQALIALGIMIRDSGEGLSVNPAITGIINNLRHSNNAIQGHAMYALRNIAENPNYRENVVSALTTALGRDDITNGEATNIAMVLRDISGSLDQTSRSSAMTALATRLRQITSHTASPSATLNGEIQLITGALTALAPGASESVIANTITTLTSAMNNTSLADQSRVDMINTLGSFGRSARTATSALNVIVRDYNYTNEYIASAASNALRLIGAE